MQIIPSQASIINYHSSAQKVDLSSVTAYNQNRLPTNLFKLVKAKQHALAKVLCEQHGLKPTTRALLSELINTCDKQGRSQIAQQTLSYRIGVSTKTIERNMKLLVSLGIIIYRKNGYLVSNTTTLLFLQHVLPYETDKLSDNLTPSEPANRQRLSEGMKDEEKRGSDELADALTAQEIQTWDEYLPLTEQEKSFGMQKLKELKSLLTSQP